MGVARIARGTISAEDKKAAQNLNVQHKIAVKSNRWLIKCLIASCTMNVILVAYIILNR